jgi:hypothetical protein
MKIHHPISECPLRHVLYQLVNTSTDRSGVG